MFRIYQKKKKKKKRLSTREQKNDRAMSVSQEAKKCVREHMFTFFSPPEETQGQQNMTEVRCVISFFFPCATLIIIHRSSSPIRNPLVLARKGQQQNERGTTKRKVERGREQK
jgi:hypothetical protein